MQDHGQTATQSPVYSEFTDDPDFTELLEMFLESMAEKQQEMVDSFQSGETDQLRSLAHQLKGAGGGYGFNDLTTLSAKLESACKANDIDRVGESLDQVLGYMARMTV